MTKPVLERFGSDWIICDHCNDLGLLKLAGGRARDVHWLMWLLAVLVLARYAFLAV